MGRPSSGSPPPGRLGDAPELPRILAFLADIGLQVERAALPDATVLPGAVVLPAMRVADGRLLYDPDTPGWAGDLLHEAGHLAVTDPAIRNGLPEVGGDAAEEMATLAWSYAAAMAIGLAPETVFHAGYPGGAEYLIVAYAQQGGPGVPMLRYWGMTPHPEDAGPHFPAMRLWLRPGA